MIKNEIANKNVSRAGLGIVLTYQFWEKAGEQNNNIFPYNIDSYPVLSSLGFVFSIIQG